MSEIKFKCPHCEAPVTLAEAAYGTTVDCPACKAPVIVPERPKPAARVAVLEPEGAAAPATAQEERDLLVVRPAMRGFAHVLALGGVAAAVVLAAAVKLGHAWWGSLLCVLVFLGCYFYALYRVKATEYRLTTQRLFVRRGLVARAVEELELYRATDVNLSQGFCERLLGVGRVILVSTDARTPRLEIAGVVEPEKVKETLRAAFRAARAREGVRPAEFVQQ